MWAGRVASQELATWVEVCVRCEQAHGAARKACVRADCSQLRSDLQLQVQPEVQPEVQLVAGRGRSAVVVADPQLSYGLVLVLLQ